MATNVSQRMLDSSGTDRRLVTIARSVFALLLIAYRLHFGLVDDTMFLDSVLVGKWLPAFVSRAGGRFLPLQLQEYSLVALVSATPFAFFLTNALEAVLTGWLLVRLGQMAMRTRARVVPYVVACCCAP